MTRGERIAHAREGLGWNQRQLAKAAGIEKSHGLISMIETGDDSRNTELETLRRIATALYPHGEPDAALAYVMFGGREPRRRRRGGSV